MGRIDRVFEVLISICTGDGITTIELANILNLSRANVSNDLNRLCKEGKVIKKSGKPVLYYISDEFKSEAVKRKENKSDTLSKRINSIDLFAIKNESLYSAVEQAKAAILYPPNGMNCLILGETGVGKSMFVGLMHRYAVEINIFNEESPFIIFNCADYANNPQLLLSQLFGAKRGSYTGADSDKSGLIEKADGGILFLDEVHRLPPEGQEMLFTFMDKGIYRRLGETEVERKAKVLIISATTENPEKALLKTFTRRIPMFINILELEKRTMNERFELIATFIREECTRVNKDIKVSINSIKALLSYKCPSNIGQLKADIQLICAKVYADYILKKKNEMKINTFDLPNHIKQGLYIEVEHRQFWSKLIDLNKRYCIFNKENDEVIFEEYNEEISIYELVDIRYRELKSRGVDEENLQDAMMIDIDEYFKHYISDLSVKQREEKLEALIDEEIISVIKEVIKFGEESLDIILNKNIYYGIAMHINSSINRIRANKRINNPQLNKIRVENPKEFNVALDCIKIIERAVDISIPIDEAGYLTKFFIYNENDVNCKQNKVSVIVIAHGKNTASSMVEAVNELVGSEYAVGIDAPMNEKPYDVLERLKLYLNKNKIENDIMLLVDMGSLTTFGKMLESEFNIKIKVFPLVSTLHVVEATRKAIMGDSLNQIFSDVIKVNSIYENELQEEFSNIDAEKVKKLAIVSVCSTGEGVAIQIKNELKKNLEYDNDLIEIVTLRFNGRNAAINDIRRLSNEYNIIAIVSAFDIDYDVEIFSLEEIIIGDGIKKLQNIIEVESMYYKISNTLKENLKNVDGEHVTKDIKSFIYFVQNELGKTLQLKIVVGISLHMACMIDRLKEGGIIEPFENRESFIYDNINLYKCVKIETDKLNRRYSIDINDDEICFLIRFLKNN